ncbi:MULTISPECIES: autotransporter domain-containing protein [Acetobacter]|uniref:autotransporter outer membrane beta-barrel domain-containing protein n=1 Tax=Acetobacter TaxID=434 RepID=UPI0020A1A424|nr:autotransporter domain-containing protein [Acetobacter lovaniensis]
MTGLVPGLLVVLSVAFQKAAHAENTLYLTGSQTTYRVSGQENFFVPVGNCSDTIAPSPLCVDGGATLEIVGAGATVESTAQVYVGFKTSGTSSLSIQGGGGLLLNHAVMQVGWSGGNGLVNVSGAGSRIVTSPESILVVGTGDNGNYGSPFFGTTNKTYGTLNITSGGQVLAGTVAAGLYGDGVGTVTVDGANSLLQASSDYYVNGGTGIVGGTGTTQVSNGGTLVVGGQVYFGGDRVDGDGSLILQSGGMLVLGDRTANGQTLSALVDQEGGGGQSHLILAGGGIRLINSGLNTDMTMQLTGGVQSTFDTNGRTAVLSGMLTGNGGLAKLGEGTLILSGANTYTGGTDVQSGVLEVDGGVVSPVNVYDGAILAGVGSVGTTTVASGGGLSPGMGSTGGALHVVGNLSMNQGSSLLVNSLSTTQGLVQVTGSASLSGGTVRLLGVEQNLHYGEQYTLLSAAQGVSGQYEGVSFEQAGAYPFLSPSLLYTANTVNLQLLRNAVPFAAVAQTRNQRAAGNGLQGMAVDSSVVRAVVQLGGTRVVDGALDALSGEIHASMRTLLLQDSMYVRQAVSDRLAGAWCDNGPAGQSARGMGVRLVRGTDEGCVADRAALWSQAYGGFGNNSGDGNAASLRHSTSGLIVGADTPLGEEARWRIGGLVSYGRSMVDGGGRSASGRSNNITLGGYVGARWGGWRLHVEADYAWNLLSLSRQVTFAGFGNSLSSHYDGGTAQGTGELGYRFHMGRAVLVPFGNVAYVNQHTSSFREQGGVAALRGRAMASGVTFATFGVRASASFQTHGVWVTPHALLGYRHAFGILTATTHEVFAIGAGAYGMEVAGISLSPDAVVMDVGGSVRLTDRIDIGVSYVGQYGGPAESSGAHGSVTVRF